MTEKYRWLDIRALGEKAMMRTSAQVVRYFDEERYTDPDGVVWVGQGEAPDEVWVREENPEVSLSKSEMTVKMVHEITAAKEESNGRDSTDGS